MNWRGVEVGTAEGAHPFDDVNTKSAPVLTAKVSGQPRDQRLRDRHSTALACLRWSELQLPVRLRCRSHDMRSAVEEIHRLRAKANDLACPQPRAAGKSREKPLFGIGRLAMLPTASLDRGIGGVPYRVRRGEAGACNSWTVLSDETRPGANGDRLLVSAISSTADSGSGKRHLGGCGLGRPAPAPARERAAVGRA